MRGGLSEMGTALRGCQAQWRNLRARAQGWKLLWYDMSIMVDWPLIRRGRYGEAKTGRTRCTLAARSGYRRSEKRS